LANPKEVLEFYEKGSQKPFEEIGKAFIFFDEFHQKIGLLF